MAKEEFIFNVNTLVGCNYSILRELKREFKVEKKYRNKFFWSQMASMTTTGLSYIDKMRYDSLSKNLEIIKPPNLYPGSLAQWYHIITQSSV